MVAIVVYLCGCQPLVSAVTKRLGEDLSNAVLNSDDLEVMSEGLPAFLILIDALLQGNANNPELLFSAAQLNGSYAAAFVNDREHRRSLAGKARDYAFAAACARKRSLCQIESFSYDEMLEVAAGFTQREVSTLYGIAREWAGWIQANSDDMHALIQLPKVILLFERMLELDEEHDFGAPHMFMGVFESLLPASLGGRPQVARDHFLRALEISNDQNLYAKVLFAENFARKTYNRDLHDKLLDEVMAADPYVEGYTLQNRVAQEIARRLKDDADNYF